MSVVLNEPHVPIAGPMPHTPEWYALRQYDPGRDIPATLGASDAAAVLGVSPYSTPLQLYLEKRGEMDKDFTPEQLERMRLGLALEPVILSEYATKTGFTIDANQPVYHHPKHTWMTATPDAAAIDLYGQEIGVECKATSWRMHDTDGIDVNKFGEEGSDEVPAQYVIQVQQQMAVMGWQRVDLPVLFDGSQMRIYTVERDDAIIDQLIEAGAALVRNIIDGMPPEPDYTRDGEAIRKRDGFRDNAEAVQLDEDVDQWAQQYRELGKQEKEIKERRTIFYNRILSSLKGNKVGLLPNGKRVSRTQVAPKYITAEDVESLHGRIGEVKVKGFERLNLPRS